MKISIKIFCLLCGFLTVATQADAIQEANLENRESKLPGKLVEKLSDNLMLVYQDKSDRYWFATWGDGLFQYDGKSIVRYTVDDGLCHNRIDQILEDDQGNLFFNTNTGINKFDGEQFTKLPLSDHPEWKLGPNDLWYTSPKFLGEVFRYDGESLHQLKLPTIRLSNKFLAENPGASVYGVYSIYKDSRKHIWFGTTAMGVCRYDGKTFEWLSSSDVNELHNGPANGIRSMIEDRDGYYWFNTLYRYKVDLKAPVSDDELERIGIFSRFAGLGSLDRKPGGDFHEFMSTAQDNAGNLWIATHGGGVFSYDGVKLTHYPVWNGKRVVTLYSIYKDNKGVMWLGTHQDGAYRLNGDSFERFEVRSR